MLAAQWPAVLLLEYRSPYSAVTIAFAVKADHGTTPTPSPRPCGMLGGPCIGSGGCLFLHLEFRLPIVVDLDGMAAATGEQSYLRQVRSFQRSFVLVTQV